jgi:hypothetical protein
MARQIIETVRTPLYNKHGKHVVDKVDTYYTYCISRRNLRGGMHLRVR